MQASATLAGLSASVRGTYYQEAELEALVAILLEAI
jgi:hypothetical protein